MSRSIPFVVVLVLFVGALSIQASSPTDPSRDPPAHKIDDLSDVILSPVDYCPSVGYLTRGTDISVFVEADGAIYESPATGEWALSRLLRHWLLAEGCHVAARWASTGVWWDASEAHEVCPSGTYWYCDKYTTSCYCAPVPD